MVRQMRSSAATDVDPSGSTRTRLGGDRRRPVGVDSHEARSFRLRSPTRCDWTIGRGVARREPGLAPYLNRTPGASPRTPALAGRHLGVEPEVADVRTPRRIDDHVVAAPAPPSPPSIRSRSGAGPGRAARSSGATRRVRSPPRPRTPESRCRRTPRRTWRRWRAVALPSMCSASMMIGIVSLPPRSQRGVPTPPLLYPGREPLPSSLGRINRRHGRW